MLMISVYLILVNDTCALQFPKDIVTFTDKLSRRDAILLGCGSILYGKILSDSLSRICSGSYPVEHEKRVSSTFKRAITESSKNLYSGKKSNGNLDKDDRPLRILEIGIGEDFRTILNGSYDAALDDFFAKYPNRNVAITGLDLIDLNDPNKKKAANLAAAQNYLQQKYSFHANIPPEKITFEVMQGNISESLPFITDGYFDVITCCLLLCSVADQTRAIKEIVRMLRSNGGTFGYLEHVAVDLNLDYENSSGEMKKTLKLLELKVFEREQIFFDPTQQILAHNCHLHRNTANVILHEFMLNDRESIIVENERFFVNNMWPISCQTCGVIVKR